MLKNNFEIILAFVFLICFSSYSQNQIKVKQIHKNSISNMQGLIDLANEKAGFTKNNQIMLNRYMNFSSDWNDDGLIDLVVPVGGDPELGSFISLVRQKKINGKISFEYDENYSVLIEGDGGQIHRTASDFNKDGLTDLYVHTQNYHGRDGYQPDFYIAGCPWNTHEKLLSNTGNGFEITEIDDKDAQGCPQNRYNSTAYDIDNDGFDEVLASSYYVGENYVNENGQTNHYVIRYYDFNDLSGNEKFKTKFIFSEDKFSKLRNYQFDSNYFFDKGDKIFIPLRGWKYETFLDGIVGFVGDEYWLNNSQIQTDDKSKKYYNLEMYMFDKNDGISSGKYEMLELFEGNNNYILADDWSVHVVNLDDDEDYEYILLLMENTNTYKQANIRVYDHDATEITNKWIGWSTYLEEYNIDSKNDFDAEIDSNSFNFDQSYNHANGIHVVDIDNDGDADIVPQNGWYFNSTGDLSNRDYTYFIFINNGEKFIPTQVKFPQNHKNSSGLIFEGGQFNGFKIPVDLDQDGYYEIVQMRSFYNGNAEDINYDIIELFYDTDNDSVSDRFDNCPDTTEGVIVDVNGCEVFDLPLDNNKVSVMSSTCIGNTDGSIGLSVEDASYSYLVTITGQDDPITLGAETKTASVTGLGKGTYTVCFTVEGQDTYEQCFEVNIEEPKALSAFIDVNNDTRQTSIQLSGSSTYTVDINGQSYDVKGDRFTTNLPTGLSIITISTDLDCQGIIEREVFISEDIHYYPNPTQTDVNVHVSGEDTLVQVSVFSEKGDLIYSREQEIQDFSRKTNIDLSTQITGTYIVVMDGQTVRKTFKIIVN